MSSARNFTLMIWNLYVLVLYFYFGKGTQWEFFFIISAVTAAVIYPKTETLIMYFMIALSFVFFFAVKLYGPDYAGEFEIPEALKLVNSASDSVLFIMV